MFGTANKWAAAFTSVALILSDGSFAADLPVKVAPGAPAMEAPFFFINDNRLTYAYLFTGAYPGSSNRTAQQVYAFTHFDAWAYGTNMVNLQLIKYDATTPASPCPVMQPRGCAGATEFYGMIRSTFGFNQIFNTKAFNIGWLKNVSLQVGVDGETMNTFTAPNKRSVVAGLQFAFDLPYNGFFNVAPLVYKEWNHNSFFTPAFVSPAGPGVTDGNLDFNPTWAVETNYYMDLGFLPESLRYFSISGRASWIGPKGAGATTSQLPAARLTPSAVELNSEPIRLIFDASKAMYGPKYSHLVDVWVAYRYWQNKYGLDHSVNAICTAPATNRSCTESSVYSGVSVKF